MNSTCINAEVRKTVHQIYDMKRTPSILKIKKEAELCIYYLIMCSANEAETTPFYSIDILIIHPVGHRKSNDNSFQLISKIVVE